jgi:hypothetical protein
MTVLLPTIDDTVRPIYLDDSGELYCVVDLEDYAWATQWRWKAVRSKGAKVKWYAFRTTRTLQRRHVAIWLHKEICLRARGLPPTERHTIGDHLSGNSLDDRRENLRWATRSENRRNQHGIALLQLQLAVARQDASRLVSGVGRRKREIRLKAARFVPVPA